MTTGRSVLLITVIAVVGLTGFLFWSMGVGFTRVTTAMQATIQHLRADPVPRGVFCYSLSGSHDEDEIKTAIKEILRERDPRVRGCGYVCDVKDIGDLADLDTDLFELAEKYNGDLAYVLVGHDTVSPRMFHYPDPDNLSQRTHVPLLR